MKSLIWFVLAGVILALYILNFDQIDQLKKQYFMYISALGTLGWPLFMIFNGYRKKKEDRIDLKTKSAEEKEQDRAAFAKVGMVDPAAKNLFPTNSRTFLESNENSNN